MQNEIQETIHTRKETKPSSYPFDGHQVHIALVRETPHSALPARYINQPEDVQDLMQSLTEKDREHFAVILLNTKNRVIGVNVVSIGTLNATLVSPREVFKAAILANANSCICCHNHPSGETEPSMQDIQVSKQLKKAGDILQIKILDHIILGDQSHYSMHSHGLL